MAHREMLLRVQIGAQGVYIENGACGGAYLDIPPESVPQITAMAATPPCRREPSDGEPGLLVTALSRRLSCRSSPATTSSLQSPSGNCPCATHDMGMPRSHEQRARPSENEATIDGKVATHPANKQWVMISPFHGIFTGFGPSRR